MARLNESQHIKGLNDPLKIAMYETNHYGPGTSYPPA